MKIKTPVKVCGDDMSTELRDAGDRVIASDLFVSDAIAIARALNGRELLRAALSAAAAECVVHREGDERHIRHAKPDSDVLADWQRRRSAACAATKAAVLALSAAKVEVPHD